MAGKGMGLGTRLRKRRAPVIQVGKRDDVDRHPHSTFRGLAFPRLKFAKSLRVSQEASRVSRDRVWRFIFKGLSTDGMSASPAADYWYHSAWNPFNWPAAAAATTAAATAPVYYPPPPVYPAVYPPPAYYVGGGARGFYPPTRRPPQVWVRRRTAGAHFVPPSRHRHAFRR